MIKPKPIAIAAAVGFVLSFIVGICCKVNFGFVVLRAFLFALLCGGISFAAIFVTEKFLKDADSSAEVSQSETETSSEETEVLEDILPDEDSAPEFFVLQSDFKNRKKQTPVAAESKSEPLNKTDTTESQPKIEKKDELVEKSQVSPSEAKNDQAFKPINLATGAVKKDAPPVQENVATKTSPSVENVDENSVQETGVQESDEQKLDEKKPKSSLDAELDELPDFSSVVTEATENIEDVIPSSESSSFSSSSASSESVNISQDTDTIAQAIKTMMNRD